jgi:hypothetical protein
MEMRIFAYNSNVLLVMATLTLDRNEAIKTDFINLINSATDMGALEKLYKQAKKALSASTTKVQEEDGDSKEYILAGLAEACREMKLARQGKLKGRPARELLNEL